MNNIKKIRLSANKTQVEVAKATNIPQNTYSNYETGKTLPDAENLIKLAQYFHTTIDNLVGNETPYLIDKSQFTNKQLELIEKIKKLNEEQCRLLDAYVEGLMQGQKERQSIIERFNKK